VPFRTYPHVDMKDAGARAVQLLFDRIRRGQPWEKALRQLDFWIPLGAQCTLMPPMESVMTERAAIAERSGIAELAFCFGFPYADFPGCGPALAVYADTRSKADEVADEFLSLVNLREHEFTQELFSSSAAVAEAKRLTATTKGPIIIADTQDNPGGGGHGDTTELLSELVRQQARGALVCLINDQQSAAACHAAGEGAIVSLTLGGKSDRLPYQCSARVERLTDGHFMLTGPMRAGNPGNLGPSALIDIDGVKVIVVTRKMQALDQAIIRNVGIDPASCPILVLKSSVHFRADFGPIAGRVIVAVAPGPVVADPATLNFQHVRADIRRRPAGKSKG
jgi:microcystin degradation protein MlrC